MEYHLGKLVSFSYSGCGETGTVTKDPTTGEETQTCN
jgi:hypothetical protein